MSKIDKTHHHKTHKDIHPVALPLAKTAFLVTI